MRNLNIYTDGACSNNQEENNIGGYGAILEYGHIKKELYGGEKNTTNNRMEMKALLIAFEAIKKEGQRIRVFSDSSYLMECFRKKWYVDWQKNGWKTKAKKPVENRDLWEKLIVYLDSHDISFYRVKGHVNLEGRNETLLSLFNTFKEYNGEDFSYEDFIYITKMNRRADELANLGIDEVRA